LSTLQNGAGGITHGSEDFAECRLGKCGRGCERNQTTANQQAHGPTTESAGRGGETTHEEAFQEKFTRETLFLRL
jgi:hypothetical protein